MFVIKDGIWIENVPLLSKILVCSIFILVLTSCSNLDKTKFSMQEWKYEQLRAIDPVDADIPHLDIVAVYITEGSTNLSIRVDLLDIELYDSQHFFIMIDYKPGGSEELPFESSIESRIYNPWDLAIEISSDGEIRGLDSKDEKIFGLRANVYKDTFLDTIIVNILNNKLIPKRTPFSLDIYMLEPTNGILVDSVTSIHSSGLPPPPSQVVLGFWNTFQAFTPAQALRKWDGAHSGPLSSRHGLRYLVEGSEFSGLPVVLFDVGVVPAGVALGFLGVWDDVIGLGGLGCIGCDLGCVSGIGYTHSRKYLTDYNTLSVDTRIKIVEAALTGETICMGGDFSQTLWGVPSVAEQVFRYIKAHPWIKPIEITDLQTTASDRDYCHGVSEPIFELDVIDPILRDNFQKQYLSTTEIVLKELAWQTHQTLLCPANPLDPIILESYFGQLGHILSAAEWMEKPHPISRCDIDLDWDQDYECVLASEGIYLTVEPKGGYVAFAFYKDDDTIHQFLGPMYEVVVGLGDPVAYKPEYGVFADARLIPGALARINHHTEYFSFSNDGDQIELVSETLRVRKTISITDKGIQIKWISDEPIDFQIPLILDPWLRYTSDWSTQYYKQASNGDWIFGIKNQFEIVIKTSADYVLDTFLDSKALLNQPENPNFKYPDGHYLPFPTAVLVLSPTETALVELVLRKP